MISLKDMPTVGLAVIVIIAILFVLAVVALLAVYSRYVNITRRIADKDRSSEFMRFVENDFSLAYKQYGEDANTPAIISNAIATKLSGSIFCERFLNNAVSLFVTLGLFGTFMGLSLSVSSLTELISFSNTSEWLSVLDSVGGGLMSALSGMGVAFYTSLVGVACSILLTVLRSVFNPATAREKMSTRLELYLDQTLAPTLQTEKTKDEATLIHQLIDGLNSAADSMDRTLKDTTLSLQNTIEASKTCLVAFHQTVEKFNNGIHDCSDINYNLQGSVERMDICVRNLVSSLKDLERTTEKGLRQ